MNTNVNFDISKLLKEKGYNELCSKIYLDGELKDAWKKVNYDDTLPSAFYIAPTIAEVVMWLYEKHNIWIDVNITRYGRFYCNIIRKESCIDLNIQFTWEFTNQLNDYNSPTQTYSEAIFHTLKNLI